MTPEPANQPRCRYWTTEELRQLAQLLEEGLSAAAIGVHLGGRSRGSVWYAMQRFGLKFPDGSPRLYTRRRDGKQIRAGGGARWTDAELAKVAELAALRISAAKIADQLPGRSRQAVEHRRRRMGLGHYAADLNWRRPQPGPGGVDLVLEAERG